MTKQDEDSGDGMGAFLDVLAQDILTRPDRLTALPDGLRAQIEQLTRAVSIDHHEPLPDGVEL